MSREHITVARRQDDGTLVQVFPDGTTIPFEATTNWDRLRAMTDDEVEAAALADPGAQPSTEEQLSRMGRIPGTKTLRRALRLSQEEFAARFHIPLVTVRDWEEGRAEPDQLALSYLRAIAGDPDGVEKALNRTSSRQ